MKAIKIKDDIYWVGAIDWTIRNFHGYNTGRGTTYGAYLIIDEKITLIDTVKAEYTDEFISRIEDIVPIEKIDIIISNHVEMDHSGALPAIMSRCPEARVYTSGASGVKGLTAHYGSKDYIPVKSGDSISIGKRTLEFVGTPMLHWPDNMITYCPEEKILFSNDAFGQHLASSERFDDELSLSMALSEAKRYYGNIIMCYGRQAQAAWSIVSDLKPEIIAPSHGVVWRSHVPEILDAYKLWSDNAPKDAAMVVYDSMWHSTEKMAKVIEEAFRDCGMHANLYDLKGNHYSYIIPDLLTSKYLAVGSPTLNGQMLPLVSSFLCYLKGLSPKDRQAFAFGSFGWSGQGIDHVEEALKECGFQICMDKIKVNYIPTKEDLDKIYQDVINMVNQQS